MYHNSGVRPMTDFTYTCCSNRYFFCFCFSVCRSLCLVFRCIYPITIYDDNLSQSREQAVHLLRRDCTHVTNEDSMLVIERRQRVEL